MLFPCHVAFQYSLPSLRKYLPIGPLISMCLEYLTTFSSVNSSRPFGWQAHATRSVRHTPSIGAGSNQQMPKIKPHRKIRRLALCRIKLPCLPWLRFSLIIMLGEFLTFLIKLVAQPNYMVDLFPLMVDVAILKSEARGLRNKAHQGQMPALEMYEYTYSIRFEGVSPKQ